MEIGQDIGPVSLSGSCWPRAPLKCGALAPSSELQPHRGTPGPGSSWLLWRPLWSTGSLAPTQTDASALRICSLRGHTPLLWRRLGEKRRVQTHKKKKNVTVLSKIHLWQEITTTHGAKQLKVKRHVIHKSHRAEWHSKTVKYYIHFTGFSTG